MTRCIDLVCSDTDADSDTDIEAFFDKPIADEAWLENQEKQEDDSERMKDLQVRWDGTKPVSTWYKINLFSLCE